MKPFKDLEPQEQVRLWHGRVKAAKKYLETTGNMGEARGGKRWDNNVKALAGDFNSRAELGEEAIDVNLMRANAKVVLPPLTLAEPHISVNPTVERFKDTDNIRAAEVTGVEINYWMRELKVRREVQKAILDGEATNHGYIYVGYTDTRADGYDAKGDRRENVPTVRSGQPFVRRLCPKNVLVPPGYWDIEEAPWACLAFRKPLRHVCDKFGLDPELMTATTSAFDFAEEKDDPLFNEYLAGDDNQFVTVYNIWDKETKKVYVLADGYLEGYLEEPEAWPWDTEGFPLAHYQPEDISDEFHGTPPMTYAMPQQKELNAARTSTRKRFNRSKANVFCSGEVYDQIAAEWKRAEDGDIIRVDIGDRDIRTAVMLDNGLPPDTHGLAYGQVIQQDVLNIQGVSAEQRGGGDPNVDSATASANIEKNVQIRNSDRGDKVRTLYLTIARKLWMILKQHPDEERSRLIAGPTGGLMAVKYTLKEMQGEFSFDMDFSAMQQDVPATRAARAMLNYRLFRMDPLINPQWLVLEVLKTQNVLNPESALLFLRQPEEEMPLFLQGLPVEAHERDEHQRHIQVHDQQSDQLDAMMNQIQQMQRAERDPGRAQQVESQMMKIQMATVLLTAHIQDHIRKAQRIMGAQKQPGDPVGGSNQARSGIKQAFGQETAAEMGGQPMTGPGALI